MERKRPSPETHQQTFASFPDGKCAQCERQASVRSGGRLCYDCLQALGRPRIKAGQGGAFQTAARAGAGGIESHLNGAGCLFCGARRLRVKRYLCERASSPGAQAPLRRIIDYACGGCGAGFTATQNEMA